MKKLLKILFILVILFAMLLTAGCFLLGNKLPKSTKTAAAENLANKMLNAVNANAWNKINMIQWTFVGRNKYLWDKQNGFVIVAFGKNKVILNIEKQTGTVYKNNVLINDKNADKMVEKAYSFFCNDSWWLNPVVKANDNGVNKTTTKNANELLVTYNSGGVTPGDAYLWKLDENGLPENYKMWTQILPIKGIEVKFADWTTLENGTKIAQSHHMKGIPFNVKITDLKIGNNFADFGYEKDPFKTLKNNTTTKNRNTTQKF